MNDSLISVIVPVYNTRDYVARCVNSILCQTHANFELLLIVDGARDGSLEICRDLAQKDDRIRLVSKPNEGVSATRNLGITMAKGEYVCFIDADDTVTENYLQALLTAVEADGAQMALCGYVFEREEGLIPSGEPDFSAYDREKDSLYDRYVRPLYRIDGAAYILGSCWRSIIRTSVLTEHELRFPPCRLFEDQLFLLSVLAHCDRIGAVKEAMYRYNDMVSDSAVRARYKRELLKDQLIYLEHLDRILQTLPLTQQERLTVHRYGILNGRKLLLTNAAMNPDGQERKAEIRSIRKSSLFDEKLPCRVYGKWLMAQPMKTRAAEVLIRLRLYGLLRKLRSRG